MGGILEHKSGVLSEPFNVSFVSGVDEDWRIVFGAAPMCIIDQISVLECLITLWVVIEVIKNLGEVFCSVKCVLGRNGEMLWRND